MMNVTDRLPAPLAAGLFTALGPEESQLLYSIIAAVLAVALDWLRRKITK